jgi:phage protein D
VGLTVNNQKRDKDVGAAAVSVVVEDDLNLPGMFTLELVGRDPQPNGVIWADAADLTLGTRIEVSFGYHEDIEPVIAGEVTALEPVFRVSGPSTLLVRGYDRRHRLNGARRTRTFTGQRDSEIAAQICSEADVPLEAEDSGVIHDYMVQADQTDLEFLRARARDIHFDMTMAGDTVLFRPAANASEPVLTLTFADDLIEFHPRMSLLPMTELQVRGWDPRSKDKAPFAALAVPEQQRGTMGGEMFAGEATGILFGSQLETVPASIASQAEADSLAAARLNQAALTFITGYGRCRGRTDLRVGKVIAIRDIGARFSGEYYVTFTVHSYTQRDGYITRFQVRRNAA